MQNNLIIRISNGLGNQLFMYAAAFVMAKQLSRNLFIDNETAFKSRKNYTEYYLKEFNLSSQIAPDKLKFKNYAGYFKRKFLKKIDTYSKKKSFYLEFKDKKKSSSFSNDYKRKNFSNNLFVEGHFESEKYFSTYKNEILSELTFKKNYDSIFLKQILSSNSVSICLRQNRFNEGKNLSNKAEKLKKSWNFTLEQINYINKCVKLVKKRLSNPKFFLWSNDFSNISSYFPNDEFIFIDNAKNKNPIEDLYLMSMAKNFIVTPSSFNWWGAWLSKNKNNVFRPSNNYFSEFSPNNIDFWPEKWEIIT